MLSLKKMLAFRYASGKKYIFFRQELLVHSQPIRDEIEILL